VDVTAAESTVGDLDEDFIGLDVGEVEGGSNHLSGFGAANWVA
jgi:hypothetical protein